MVDPQSLVSRIESCNEESENDGSSDSYESPPDHFLSLKESDLLVHGTRIMY
jgi:hypothetical protein